MKHRLQRQEYCVAALIVATLVVCLFFSIHQLINIDYAYYDSEASYKVSEQKNALEQGVFQKGKYPYLMIDRESRVLYADDIFGIEKNETVSIQEYLSFTRGQEKEMPGYTKNIQIITKEHEVTGYAVFMIPSSELGLTSVVVQVFLALLPMIGSIFLTGIVLFIRGYIYRKRLFQPMNEIALSAHEMIVGNYEREVLRTYGQHVGEDEMGNLLYSFELMRDELKEKQLSTERLKRQQQELISCVSHDLRTPISTIKAYSEGIRDGMAKDEETRKQYVNTIIEKTDLLTGMIKDLLEVSNAELQKMDIMRKELYFLAYLQPVFQELSGYVEHQKGIFSYEIHAEEFLFAFDAKRLTEVFYNVVENSLKYRGEEPLTIHAVVEQKSGEVTILFRDNGRGIHAEDVPYVFDKFYRGEKSRSSATPGSGLGLAICKYIVEAHEGEIYCSSMKNQGFEIGMKFYY